MIACFLDLLRDFPHDEYFDFAPLPIGATSLPVPLVAASFAPPPLWLGAILPDMSVLLTIEALDLAAFLTHEDRHFYWSSGSWYEGHGVGGVVSVGDDGWGKHVLHLHLEGVIQTRPLDPVHAIDQVALDDEILFLDVQYSLPGLPEDIPQGLLQIGFAPILIQLGNHPRVP